MHIPDNYLSPATCAVLGLTMIPILKKTADKVKYEMRRKRLPLLGLCSAVVFLIMMFNVPLPGGTSGHAVGATLIAILIGPYAAVISMTITLVIQAFFFGDGGILALGANIFNMAFIMPFVGYYIFKLIKGKRENKKINFIACFVSAYTAVNLAALAAAVELGIQPLLFKSVNGLPMYCPYPLKVTLPAMLVPHLFVVGVLEGLITSGVYAYIKRMNSEVIYEGSKVRKHGSKLKPILTLILILGIISPIGLLAGGKAWGEWNKSEINSLLGYIPEGMRTGFGYHAVFNGYGFYGLSPIVGYVLSAAVGVAFLLLAGKIASKKLAKPDKKQVK